MRLIVGLGNPGAAYANTRHNIGVWALQRAAVRWGIRLQQRGPAYRGSGSVDFEAVELAGPLDWMNVTGPAVKALLEDLACSPANLIVIHDDLDLELGRLRIKREGGAGGHNGLISILTTLGTDQFCRLKIGIGRPAPGVDPAEYVLSAFTKDEVVAIGASVDRTVQALECLVIEGVEAAMNRFNIRDKQEGDE